MTLTEFLLARIAEDEAEATALLERVDRLSSEPRQPWRVERGRLYLTQAVSLGIVGAGLGEHIARHDPGRVLAECEAKRRIVGRAKMIRDSWEAMRGGDPARAPYPDANRREKWSALETLTDLALPYADHPDYDEGWKP